MLIDAPAAVGRLTGCIALIAVKRRALGKGRLAAVMPPAERLELVRSMLAHVIDTVMSADSVARCAVVSPERDLVDGGIEVIEDTGQGLNAALTHARRVAVDSGAQDILVLPADLPLVTRAEINGFVRCGRRHGFAIAADASRQGTNALYLPAESEFRFQFGQDSHGRHVREARRLGFAPTEIRSAGLQFDVDNPQDVERLTASCL